MKPAIGSIIERAGVRWIVVAAWPRITPYAGPGKETRMKTIGWCLGLKRCPSTSTDEALVPK